MRIESLLQRLQWGFVRHGRVQCKPLSRLQYMLLRRHVADLPPALQPAPAGVRSGVAVTVHIHYPDLWPELAGRLQALPFAFDLFVSATDHGAGIEADVMRRFPAATFRRVDNHGRDVAPFIGWLAGGQLARYEFVLKVHAKKSAHRGDGDRWRNIAWDALIDGAPLQLLQAEPRLGLLGPAAYRFDQAWRLSVNGPWLLKLSQMLVIGRTAFAVDFFAGTMFWARLAALDGLARHAAELLPQFEAEAAQIDGTLAHAIERALPMLAVQAGYEIDSVLV